MLPIIAGSTRFIIHINRVVVTKVNSCSDINTDELLKKILKIEIITDPRIPISASDMVGIAVIIKSKSVINITASIIDTGT